MLTIAGVMFLKLKLHPLVAYAVAINGALFILYAIDKLFSKIRLSRIPESLLHLLTLLGGTPAAYMAQQILRHKTIKESFRKKFYIIVGFQLLIIGVFVGLILYWA